MANNFETWVKGYVAEAQALDAAATELLQAVTLGSATGVQLDGLGQIIGIERSGLDDEPYRSLLRAYIAINTSGGTIEQLLTIARLATNTTIDDGAIELVEGDIAEFNIECTQQLPTGVGAVFAEAIIQGKAAGVYTIVKYFEAIGPVFAFDGDGGSKFDGGFYLRTAIGD